MLSRVERRKTTVRRNFDAAIVIRYSILLILALFVSACATKIIEIDKSVPKLDLSREQAAVGVAACSEHIRTKGIIHPIERLKQ